MATLTASGIREHFLSHAPWVDRQKTVDTIKSGDPDRPVRRVGVGWMASIWDLQAAHRDGCELFVTHEPTFNDHRDPEGGACRRAAPADAKTKILEEAGLVVFRCHAARAGGPRT